jgi:hypothetical protein
LGSFYNDSAAYGGFASSPITHGFDLMNATVEVAPTATTNCECQEDWRAACDFGHDGGTTHCNGGIGPDPKASANAPARFPLKCSSYFLAEQQF